MSFVTERALTGSSLNMLVIPNGFASKKNSMNCQLWKTFVPGLLINVQYKVLDLFGSVNLNLIFCSLFEDTDCWEEPLGEKLSDLYFPKS